MLEILDAVIFEEFVSHPVMERLDEPVLPGLTGWDERLDCLILPSPLVQCASDEFGSVVHPDHSRAPTMVKTREVEQLNHRTGIKSAINSKGDVFAGVFINNVADLDRLTVPG